MANKPIVPNKNEKSISKRLSDKKQAQFEGDALQEVQPSSETPGAIQLHPLEQAAPIMDKMQIRLSEIKSAADSFNNIIEHIKSTGETDILLEATLQNDPSEWETKLKELDSIFAKFKSLLPVSM